MSDDCAHNNRVYTDYPGLNGTTIVEVTCATCNAVLGTYQKT